MTKHTGIGFNKLSDLGKYNNEFEDGDIYFERERDKDGKKNKNHMHAQIFLKDGNKCSFFHYTDNTPYLRKNYIIYDTKGEAYYDVIRYIGPKKNYIIKNVKNIITSIWKKEQQYEFEIGDYFKAVAVTGLTATKQKQIDRCLKKIPKTSRLDVPIPMFPKNSKFISKRAPATINRYNKSLSDVSVTHGEINWKYLNLPYKSANCTEFLLMIWYIAIGTINDIRNEDGKLILDEDFLNEIMPINPHRCTKLGLLELCKIRPLYWKKITLKNIYLKKNYRLYYENYIKKQKLLDKCAYNDTNIMIKGVKNFKGIVSINGEKKGEGIDPIQLHAENEAYKKAYDNLAKQGGL